MKYYNGITMLIHRAINTGGGGTPPRYMPRDGQEARQLRELLPSSYHSVVNSSHSDAYKGVGAYEGWAKHASPHGWCETGDVVAGTLARYTMLDCCGLKELVFTNALGQANGGWRVAMGENVDLCLDPTMPARIWLHLLFQRGGIMGTMSTAAVTCASSDSPDPSGEVIGKIKWLREYKSWVKLCAKNGVAPYDAARTSAHPETRDFLESKSPQYRRMLQSNEVFALVSVYDWIEWKGLGKVKPMPAYQNKNSSNIIYPLFLYPTMSRDANKRASVRVMWDTYSELMPVLVGAHQATLDRWLDEGCLRDVSNRYDRNLQASFKMGADITGVPESVVSPFLRQAVKFGRELWVG